MEYCNEKVYFSEEKKRSQSKFREEEQTGNKTNALLDFNTDLESKSSKIINFDPKQYFLL